MNCRLNREFISLFRFDSDQNFNTSKEFWDEEMENRLLNHESTG